MTNVDSFRQVLLEQQGQLTAQFWEKELAKCTKLGVVNFLINHRLEKAYLGRDNVDLLL